MSALELRNQARRGKTMARETRQLCCSIPGCKTVMTSGVDRLNAAASHDAYVAGYFAGSLCAKCAGLWKKTWERALEGWEW